jgi:outer membrane protein OmpA-like peptidoglycan-associated protein|tara:strand:- start:627 stop:1307 length:681 start_codon:yes stop_codon:yes gene_type:complete
MKKLLLILILAPFFTVAQDLAPRLGVTLVNFTLLNDFDKPYPNAEIKFVRYDNTYHSIITNAVGKNSILLNQGNSFRIICVVNGIEYEFDNPLEINKKEELFTLNMSLKLELYSEIIELSNVYFLSGKYAIQETSKLELDKIVQDLLSNNLIIEIAGHTDNVGNKNDNQVLSEKRALSIKSYFVSKGFSKERIVCVGYGDIQPVTNNTNSEERAKNRRIEMRIMKQ